MNIPQRRAVSPIIATLLLIAIAVAAGIIVYVFVGGLSGNLTKSGGNQVTENLVADSYVFTGTTGNEGSAGNGFTCPCINMTVRNVGPNTVSVATIYFDGQVLTATNSPTTSVSAAGTQQFLFAKSAHSLLTPGVFIGLTTVSSGVTYSLKFVTSDGGQFTFNVIAGSSG